MPPKMPPLKPIVKVSPEQWKALLSRILIKGEKGGINPQALQPQMGAQISAPEFKTIGRTLPSQFERFSSPETFQVPRPQPMPDPKAFPAGPQLELPGIIPPSSPFTKARVGGFTPPSRSDVTFLQRPGTGLREELPAEIEKVGTAAEPVERVMGRLFEDVQGVSQAKDFPWAEARIRFLKNPDKYQAGNQTNLPEALRLRPIKDEKGLVKDLSYERLKWKPIESAEEKRVNLNRAFVRVAAEEAGVPLSVEQADDMAWALTKYWKEMGGGRGKVGRDWEQLRKTSDARYVKQPDARSYFSWSVGQYKANAEKFRQRFPREHKKLTEVWEKYMLGGKK